MIRSRQLVAVLGLVVAGACSDPKPTTGSLIVTIDGLPAGATPGVSVVGPGGYFKQLGTTTTLEDLVPGPYRVVAATVHHEQALYMATQQTDSRTIVAGKTETSHVGYALASGSVYFDVTGLPADASPVFRLFPIQGGSTRSFFIAGLVTEIPAGTYSLRADTVTSFLGDRLAPSTVEQTIVIAPSLTPVNVGMSYTLSSGSLALSVSGLPGDHSVAPVVVTGPHGYARATDMSITYRGLEPGTYAIAAAIANGVCPDVFTPSTGQQSVNVDIGTTAGATVSYTLSQASAQNLDFSIDGMYLVQTVQDYAGTVPMVAGRSALLRVFGRANQCNTAKPKVRVTLSTGAVIDIAAAEDSVRVSPVQDALTASWNVLLPGSAVQPGLAISAEIDADGAIAEADEGNNRFPASGSQAVDVKVMPVVHLRFVPVVIAGLTGSVAPDSMLSLSRRMHPVADYDYDVRTPYTSTHSSLQADDANGWGSVLGEIAALRVADTATRYYAGVVHVTYTSGVAGVAFVGGRSSLIWDHMPSGSEVAAHELGHNYNRNHSPCGNPGGIDPAYPYAGGYIGRYGYDLTTQLVRAPESSTDVMGYCNNKWISDYTYVGMMNYLVGNPSSIQAPSDAVVPSLLVWGRIVNGQPVLEPAYEIMARATFPAPGADRIAMLDDAGSEIAGVSFDAERIADLPGDQETFAFAVPVSMLRGRSLAALRLTAGARSVTTVRGADVAAGAAAVVTRAGPRAARVRWDASRFPGLMIRDAATGRVLSFARGGDATVATSGTSLELVYSNRVHSGRVVMPLK